MTEAIPTPAAPKSRNPLRRLYDWVLAWSQRPSGEWALWVLSFAESSVFPIPPDVLLIPLILGRRTRWFRFALGCSIASVLGGLAGYGIGFGLWEATRDWFIPAVFSEETFARVQSLYGEHAALATFGAALTPIPYKVFTIAGGVMAVPLLGFTLASMAGRGLRFFAVAALVYWIGEPAKRFIDRWFNWLALAFFVLLALGFMALKYWFV